MLFKIVRVEGDSMSPSLCHNDYVFVCTLFKRFYRKGDVVVARHPEYGLIIKRITQVAIEEFKLEGDNPLSSYIGSMPLASIMGKVVFHIKAKPGSA